MWAWPANNFPQSNQFPPTSYPLQPHPNQPPPTIHTSQTPMLPFHSSVPSYPSEFNHTQQHPPLQYGGPAPSQQWPGGMTMDHHKTSTGGPTHMDLNSPQLQMGLNTSNPPQMGLNTSNPPQMGLGGHHDMVGLDVHASMPGQAMLPQDQLPQFTQANRAASNSPFSVDFLLREKPAVAPEGSGLGFSQSLHNNEFNDQHGFVAMETFHQSTPSGYDSMSSVDVDLLQGSQTMLSQSSASIPHPQPLPPLQQHQRQFSQTDSRDPFSDKLEPQFRIHDQEYGSQNYPPTDDQVMNQDDFLLPEEEEPYRSPPQLMSRDKDLSHSHSNSTDNEMAPYEQPSSPPTKVSVGKSSSSSNSQGDMMQDGHEGNISLGQFQLGLSPPTVQPDPPILTNQPLDSSSSSSSSSTSSSNSDMLQPTLVDTSRHRSKSSSSSSSDSEEACASLGNNPPPPPPLVPLPKPQEDEDDDVFLPSSPAQEPPSLVTMPMYEEPSRTTPTTIPPAPDHAQPQTKVADTSSNVGHAPAVQMKKPIITDGRRRRTPGKILNEETLKLPLAKG